VRRPDRVQLQLGQQVRVADEQALLPSRDQPAVAASTRRLRQSRPGATFFRKRPRVDRSLAQLSKRLFHSRRISRKRPEEPLATVPTGLTQATDRLPMAQATDDSITNITPLRPAERPADPTGAARLRRYRRRKRATSRATPLRTTTVTSVRGANVCPYLCNGSESVTFFNVDDVRPT
jgi:hypothetical protein